MKTKIIRYRQEDLPPLTEAEKAHLAALAAMPDKSIDYSDIPPLSDEALKTAVRARFYRPIKQQITARVDADVVDWLKSYGKGYQSRLNAILRREMLATKR
jgi:uncharacterized protein (DUF4415 family)